MEMRGHVDNSTTLGHTPPQEHAIDILRTLPPLCALTLRTTHSGGPKWTNLRKICIDIVPGRVVSVSATRELLWSWLSLPRCAWHSLFCSHTIAHWNIHFCPPLYQSNPKEAFSSSIWHCTSLCSLSGSWHHPCLRQHAGHLRVAHRGLLHWPLSLLADQQVFLGRFICLPGRAAFQAETAIKSGDFKGIYLKISFP